MKMGFAIHKAIGQQANNTNNFFHSDALIYFQFCTIVTNLFMAIWPSTQSLVESQKLKTHHVHRISNQNRIPITNHGFTPRRRTLLFIFCVYSII